MVQVSDILTWLDKHAPFRYAESWDRCGLQVGDPKAGVNRVLVALDPGSEILEEAKDQGCQCLVTHHPLIFRSLNAVRADEFPGKLVIEALRSEINLIAAHTNLDAARGGTNDELARLLNIEAVEPLEVERSWVGEERYGGMGRVGFLNRSMSLEKLIEEIQKILGGIEVRGVGNPAGSVRRIALCTGSGGSLVERVISAGCDVYVTGDIKYHEAQRAVEAGLTLIDIGHFASERLIIQPLASYLRLQASHHHADLEVFTARREKDPFWFSGKALS